MSNTSNSSFSTYGFKIVLLLNDFFPILCFVISVRVNYIHLKDFRFLKDDKWYCCMLLGGVVLHDYDVFSIPCEMLHDGIKHTHQSISLSNAIVAMHGKLTAMFKTATSASQYGK